MMEDFFEIIVSVGAIRDLCETHPRPFLWPYCIFGGCLAFSGAILFAIPVIIKRQKQSPQSLNMKTISHEQRQQPV